MSIEKYNKAVANIYKHFAPDEQAALISIVGFYLTPQERQRIKQTGTPVQLNLFNPPKNEKITKK